MATHSSILASRIPRTEKPFQSEGLVLYTAKLSRPLCHPGLSLSRGLLVRPVWNNTVTTSHV